MSEKHEAYRLAEKLLDVPSCDPDDELRVLSRQLLKHKEWLEGAHKQLQNADWEGRAQTDLIHSNRDAMLDVYKEALRRVRTALEANNVKLALEVVEAVNSFHPMHEWKGWPE